MIVGLIFQPYIFFFNGSATTEIYTLSLHDALPISFAALLHEIACIRVLVMIVGGSTYAFTLVLLVFLLGIGIGCALVARRFAIPSVTATPAAAAQGLTASAPRRLFLIFGLLPR